MQRRLIHFAVFLTLGAIINIAVAWVCVGLPRWRLDQDVVSSATEWPRPVPADWPKPVRTMKKWNRFMTMVWTQSAETTTRGPAGKEQPVCVVAVDSVGLPFRSLCFHAIADWRTPSPVSPYYPAVEEVYGILTLPQQLQDWLWITFVPIRPVPLGFAANTIVYAGMAWGLVAGQSAVRRSRRRRRGLCPACAYPIGSSPVCTECGAPVPVPSAAVTPP